MQMYIQYVHTPGAKLRSAIKTIPASDLLESTHLQVCLLAVGFTPNLNPVSLRAPLDMTSGQHK